MSKIMFQLRDGFRLPAGPHRLVDGAGKVFPIEVDDFGRFTMDDPPDWVVIFAKRAEAGA